MPDYYFRIRDNGAVVFRVETESRERRIELIELATVNVKNGNIKPHGETVLSATDTKAIKEWMAERVALLAEREIDDMHRALDYLNMTAQ